MRWFVRLMPVWGAAAPYSSYETFGGEYQDTYATVVAETRSEAAVEALARRFETVDPNVRDAKFKISVIRLCR